MRALFVAVIFLVILEPAHAQITNWSKRISSKTEKPVSMFINPHVSEINVLIIDGKRFEHVRGVKQFYLPVPETNAVVFVADEKDYSVTYHFFNMDTDEDIAIRAPSSLFGHSIGFSPTRDSVTKVADGIATLCNISSDARSALPELANMRSCKAIYSLDLNKRTVTGKILYIDKDGKIIEERAD
jgi:hypothetical protein